jgi:hypothetical protein
LIQFKLVRFMKFHFIHCLFFSCLFISDRNLESAFRSWSIWLDWI